MTTNLLFLLLFLFPFLASSDDSAAMSKLISSLSTPPKGWSLSTHFCNWTNVNCDTTETFVTTIDLNSASISGTLPPEINTLSQLKSIALQKNSFKGTVPSFENMTNLEEIYLDSNEFDSVPANFLLGLHNLRNFSISENSNLSPWSIPLYLTESSNLASFYASNASVNGIIPEIFESFPNLQNLRLSYNNLTGSLPRSFMGSNIRILWLNNQKLRLSGTVDVLSNMTEISQVWLHLNSFSGGIPDLSKCVNLVDLQMRENSFTGIVPLSLMNLPKLETITLQNNKLQGPFPEFPSKVATQIGTTNSFCLDKPGDCDPQVNVLLEVARDLGYPIPLADSWKGNDACQNWKFVNCDTIGKNVTGVTMGKQGFSGTISPAFAKLSSLRTLVLSDNELTGSIPGELTGLTQLQTIDVSNNNLSGPVPIFPTGVKFIDGGNLFLGMNVSDGGSDGGSGSGSSDSGRPGSGKGSGSAGMVAGVVVAIVLFVGVLLFVSYKCYYIKKRCKIFKKFERVEQGKEMVKASVTNGVHEFHSDHHSEKNPVFLEGGNVVISIELLRQVTGDFSEKNILGKGGFGVVYKGELPDGTKIAVKRMESGIMGTKGMGEFQAEIAVLTKVRHRHLVALLGYCINGNERLLVYEYMPQGTLSQHLFDRRENGYYSPLSWKERVTIALDVGRGVEYLHSLAQQSFIHRDLKPSNILLSDDMRAKVADFGLVKHAPDGNCSIETRLAGTFGYLAPEYAATGRVTTKVDVYAFGVVLMELITGRRALDETVPDDRSHLVTWFRRVLINKDNLKKSIDPILEPDDETYESICRVAELAGHCTAREPVQRPDMGHAVNVLGPLVQEWKPSLPEEEDSFGIDLQMSLPQTLQRWQANEGTSRMFDDMSYSQTNSSIPGKIGETFGSSDCR